MRFTSGSGAECLMGAAEGRSMLYLEARCIAISRAAGAQGVQNGGIDGVSVTASVPDGMREVIAENLCVMLHDLESCAGNDTLMSFSDIRRTAHTLPLLLAGADFLFSGFGSIPAYDNAFGPSNFNAEDLDDYLVVQRDWGFEGGLRAARRRGAAAPAPARRRGVPRGLRGARPGDVLGRGRRGLRAGPRQPRRAGPAAGARAGRRRGHRRARHRRHRRRARARRATGYEVEAERVLEMLRQRLLGDYLQTAAIFDEDVRVQSNLSDPNDYAGPGTGYRMGAERRAAGGAGAAGADAGRAAGRPGRRRRLPGAARARPRAPCACAPTRS